MTLGRILTGKLYECWKLLDSAFFATKLSKEYESKFDDRARNALGSLKRYFGKDNLIKAVRHRHAFHYAVDQIALGYAKLDDEEPMNIYLADTDANTLYAFADTIANIALVENIRPGNPVMAFETLITETGNVDRWLRDVIAGCMYVAIERYLGGTLDALGATEMQVEGAPSWKAVSIPYFVEIDHNDPN